MRARLCAAALLFALGCAEPPAPAPIGPRPNVLLILVDDLNTALGAYGHPVVKTPNIDKLARRGVLFERAYCQYPLCNPSRTSFLTGRRPQTTEVFDNKTSPRARLGALPFLPEIFRREGYWTVRVGKVIHGVRNEGILTWDVVGRLNRPLSKMEHREGTGGDDTPPPGGQAGLELAGAGEEGESLLLRPRRVSSDERDHLRDHHVAEETIRWLKRAPKEGGGKPFFITAGFNRPHLPFEVPEEFFDLYPPASIVLPPRPAADAAAVPAKALRTKANAPAMTPDQERQVIASYYAAVTYVDSQIGLVLKALERYGFADNTLVILTSDHGYLLGEHGLWGKVALFEPALRVPLIVAGPGIRQGARSPRTVELVDLAPTLSALTGLPPSRGYEGQSLKPLLAEPTAAWSKAAYTVLALGKEGKSLARTVRTERFRYTEWGSGSEAELYDHDRDPGEAQNLARDPAFARTKSELRKLLSRGDPPWWGRFWLVP